MIFPNNPRSWVKLDNHTSIIITREVDPYLEHRVDYRSQEASLSTQHDLLLNNTTSGLVPLNIANIATETNGLTDYTGQWGLEVVDDIGTPIDFSLPVGVNFPLHLTFTSQPAVMHQPHCQCRST